MRPGSRTVRDGDERFRDRVDVCGDCARAAGFLRMRCRNARQDDEGRARTTVLRDDCSNVMMKA
jgi:hypothetical protein